MFDLSWSHIAILVVVALLVLGPKELPNAIRTGAQLLRTGRKLANEFRSGMDELVREAELEETRRTISQAMSEGVEKTLAENVDPTGELKSAIATDPLKELETSSPGTTPAIAPPSGEPSAEASPAGAIPAEGEGATIIEHEPPPAPPHSIQPPPAESATDAASAAAPGAEDGPDQKRSAGG